MRRYKPEDKESAGVDACGGTGDAPVVSYFVCGAAGSFAVFRLAGALVVADNTFLSPVGQSPLALGADIVLHSTTKYINGHSDVVGGALVAATSELAEELTWWANCIGATGAPFDSFLTLRGLRTLQVRMRQHEETASLLARLLDEQQGVRRVYYPGLESHPQHDLAKRQMTGFGGMVSFELADFDACKRMLDALEEACRLFDDYRERAANPGGHSAHG